VRRYGGCRVINKVLIANNGIAGKTVDKETLDSVVEILEKAGDICRNLEEPR
jgi:hypothetical protein